MFINSEPSIVNAYLIVKAFAPFLLMDTMKHAGGIATLYCIADILNLRYVEKKTKRRLYEFNNLFINQEQLSTRFIHTQYS